MYGICHWLLVSRAAFQEKSRIGMATSSLRRVDRVNIKHKQNYFFFSWNQSTNGTIGYLGKIPKCYEIIILMLKFRVKIKFRKHFKAIFFVTFSNYNTIFNITSYVYVSNVFHYRKIVFFFFRSFSPPQNVILTSIVLWWMNTFALWKYCFSICCI